jgi:hypothetical protein
VQRCRDLPDWQARFLQELPRKLTAQVFEQPLDAAAFGLESLSQPAWLDSQYFGDSVGRGRHCDDHASQGSDRQFGSGRGSRSVQFGSERQQADSCGRVGARDGQIEEARRKDQR